MNSFGGLFFGQFQRKTGLILPVAPSLLLMSPAILQTVEAIEGAVADSSTEIVPSILQTVETINAVNDISSSAVPFVLDLESKVIDISLV